MKIVILDAYAANPGDLSWDEFAALGELTVYDRTAPEDVADEMGETGYLDADPEQVVAWDPELIFLDPGNMSLVRDEYQTNPGFFDSLTAVREGNLYACVSFNNYSTNVGYALADAYYAGSVIYPERFDDVNIAEKADDILEFLLGRRYYNDMKANGLTFGVIELGSAQ